MKPIQVTLARPVEFHFEGKAYGLVKGLEKKGIISPVSDPTVWVSPAKFVPKANGIDVRLTTLSSAPRIQYARLIRRHRCSVHWMQ